MLKFPLDYIAVTQTYSAKHRAIDLGWKDNPTMPIYAPDNGVVIFEGYYSNKEIACVTQHKQLKMVILYGHLSKTIVSKGDIVKQHQQIGNMGNTGNSNGNHLHYEVWANIPDNFVFSENTITTNRAKYAIDPLSVTYCYDDQTVSQGSSKLVKYIKGTNVPINNKVDQLEVIIDDLNARDTANGKVIGYVKKGVYNVLGIKKTLLYTWYQVETNLWLAYNQNWVILMPKQESELERLIRENAELKKEAKELELEIVELDKQVVNLTSQNTALTKENLSMKDKLAQINKISII